MVSNVLIKALLIILLPCIVFALYIEGQRYDPALIDFKSIPKTPVSENSTDTLPSLKEAKSISGYNFTGRQRDFTKDNLYEHVNGHAEYFIGMGFKKLTVYEYSSSGDQPEIQVEVFDMGKSIQAFGVLMDAVGSKAVSVDIGSIGYQTQSAILFIRGNYYVRVMPYKKGVSVSAFAKGFDSTLPSSTKDSFDVLARLPKLGKVISTRYVKEGYRGMDFLNNVIERQYEKDGRSINLALLLAGDNEIQKIVKTALDFAKKSGAEYEKIEVSKGEVFKINDKYEGNWALIRSRDSLLCLFGDIDDEIIQKVANVK